MFLLLSVCCCSFREVVSLLISLFLISIVTWLGVGGAEARAGNGGRGAERDRSKTETLLRLIKVLSRAIQVAEDIARQQTSPQISLHDSQPWTPPLLLPPLTSRNT